MNVINEESFSTSSSATTTIPDPFQQVFHIDESIHEFLSIDELPWDDLHYRSSFLSELDKFKNNFSSIFTANYVEQPQSPISITNLDFEVNLGNFSSTIPVDISVKPRIIENIHIGASCTPDEISTYKSLSQEFHDIFSWYYEEMPGIDPNIVIHEIKTYPDAKPIRQRLRPIHP